MMVRPTTIAEVARRLMDAQPQHFYIPICEFLDEFYEANGDIEMLVDEPTADLDQENAAYLAAAVEYLCCAYEIEPPRGSRSRATSWPSRAIREAIGAP